MSLFDLTHLLTLIFYLTAVRSTGTYPINMVNEQDFLLINNIMSAFMSALVSNASAQHEPRV